MTALADCAGRLDRGKKVNSCTDRIHVLELRLVHGNRSLKAFADVQVGDWIIREWRVVKENGKRPMIAPPQTSWKGPDGQIQYKTIITLPDELKGQIDFAILKLFTAELEKNDAGRPE